MSEVIALKRAIGASLMEAGFIKKSNSWYLSSDDTILVVNLQKSQYGDQFFLNAGVFVRLLGKDEFPKENQCHIRFRLPSILSEDMKKLVDSAFNVEDVSVSGEDRIRVVLIAVKDHALPFLFYLSTIDGIREALSSGKLKKSMVRKEVKDL